MKGIKFVVPGKPMGKARPRVTRRGFAYTPAPTVSYENLVKTCFAEVAEKSKWKVTDEEIYISISAFFEIPKSASKKARSEMAQGLINPTKKPDWDNIGKIICDALNGIAYHDDSQIICAKVKKIYAENEPYTEVIIAAQPKESEETDGK